MGHLGATNRGPNEAN